MGALKKWLNRFFIDGLSGMALGLFSTLIIGTILTQIGSLVGSYLSWDVGYYITVVGKIASSLTGAGIGAGVATKFKEPPAVAISAMTAGMLGAFATKIIAGTVLVNGTMTYSGPGEPLGAFIAAYVAIEVGHLIAGKTKIDIIITPIITISAGAVVGILVGPPISAVMTELGNLINWGTVQQPFIMGIVISVIMGMVLTLPISSAAIGVILGLNGIAAGAATVGCCANMVGFAFASYRENKLGGVFAQGIGTSMLQVPNIVKKPIVWLPAILTSAILGPISTCLLKMTNNPTGSGMGTCGFVGQITTFQTMVGEGASAWIVMLEIIAMHFVIPALLAVFFAETMRKLKWIKDGDMKLEL